MGCGDSKLLFSGVVPPASVRCCLNIGTALSVSVCAQQKLAKLGVRV